MSRPSHNPLSITVWLLVLLVAGYWAEHKLAELDAGCYTVAGRLLGGWKPGEYAQLHSPGDPVQMESVILRRGVRHCPPVYYVAWNSDLKEGAAELPLPKRQELATLLHCLSYKLGVKSVAVSSPLVWDDEQGEMAGLMLQRACSDFRYVGLGFAGRSAPQAQSTPELLRGAVIPAAQVQGDPGGLPAANTPQPYSLPSPLGANLLPAPDFLEDEALIPAAVETRGLSLPLLLRWNGEVMAALPLRVALAELGLSPADVQVKLGKYLRMGESILPLDAHGRTPLGSARALPLRVEDALTAYEPLPAEGQRCAVLCRPFSPKPIDGRAACLAATISRLLSSAGEQLIPTERPAGGHLMEQNLLQSSLTGRVACIVLLLGLLELLPRMRRVWRRAALLALLGGGLAAVYWCALAGVWVSICAALVCWAILALSQLHLAAAEKKEEPKLW